MRLRGRDAFSQAKITFLVINRVRLIAEMLISRIGSGAEAFGKKARSFREITQETEIQIKGQPHFFVLMET